ncbi:MULTISPECIES: response regulator transcription factor [unclassified Paenibacillus]|uniref:response regulator n=1 Tax=unclassified Paenibacillus TaxID=185978 RepID=UPI0024069B61|nr:MULTISPECIES: response regulator transcription factor [unclassified Paenibacillus]MDF9842841.1 NarL family two-component system response regulator YdfI [Paenibacillus sp. PastF-2]MDF9849291.1 NarL family two-component system response regulator YdfI [Paenibacillus sp. PastM-2]MDF9856001.1 NarL family two-component system response regulator YdfI [Paenibacillus sp. PastF-1]MDH6481132.1 NarL family two-component system response regulator YdfI [Paenibacillus sp. PastH-2]MDH6508553.1 NarL family 
MNPYQILIVDDHFVVRQGLRLILETSEQFQIAGEAENGQQALSLVDELQPDVILMDLNMPVMSGLEAMQILKDRNSRVPVLILTTYNEDELMVKGLALGARGYLLKDTSRENLFRGIESAIRGETLLSAEIMAKVIAAGEQASTPVPGKGEGSLLSDKELQILRSVARGFKSKEIAFDMGMAERTVKAHLTSIYNKLGVDSRSQAVATALERGIL